MASTLTRSLRGVTNWYFLYYPSVPNALSIQDTGESKMLNFQTPIISPWESTRWESTRWHFTKILSSHPWICSASLDSKQESSFKKKEQFGEEWNSWRKAIKGKESPDNVWHVPRLGLLPWAGCCHFSAGNMSNQHIIKESRHSFILFFMTAWMISLLWNLFPSSLKRTGLWQDWLQVAKESQVF